MAKGFAGYIMEEHRKLEEELLLDAYLKLENKNYSEDDMLYEKVDNDR